MAAPTSLHTQPQICSLCLYFCHFKKAYQWSRVGCHHFGLALFAPCSSLEATWCGQVQVAYRSSVQGHLRFGCWKYSCHEHSSTTFYVNASLRFGGINAQENSAESYGGCIFSQTFPEWPWQFTCPLAMCVSRFLSILTLFAIAPLCVF